MKDWSAPAREELERALHEHHARLVGTGVDADEVVADMRRHVETELGREGGQAVGVEEVRAVLRRLVDSDELGLPRDCRNAPPVVVVASAPPHRLRRAVLHWIFLVILPAITLGFELITGLCATELFDPIGRLSQLIAVAAVPLVFGAILLAHDRPGWVARRRLVRAAAALACGVCAYYAIQFGPLTPFAFVGIIAYGLGLLPLAPLGAFVVGLDLLGQLRRLDVPGNAARTRPVWPLVFVGISLLVVADVSGLCASLGMRWFTSDDPAAKARGLALLRSRLVDPADIDHPWRAGGMGSGTDAILSLTTGSSGRIFGAEFDRVKFAATGGARDLADPDLWRRTRGRGRAGDARWSLFGQLALDGSRLDGTIDPELLYGYVEWTMTLRNDENWPLEGRATLQLPPGGVVSRVTLWIDGEEREAAFAGRSAATKAYESVAIVQRRDPILVTTAGPDRVRLRCFPVPADGQMKFRLGITFPLQPTADETQGEFSLPSVLESNFAIPSSLRHAIWIDRADGVVEASSEEENTDKFRGPWANEALGLAPTVVRRDPGRRTILARAFDDGMVLEQEVRIVRGQARRLVLVVDGNARVLRRLRALLQEELTAGGGAGVDLWLVLDQPVSRHFTTLREASEFLAAAIDSGAVSDESGGEMDIPHRGGFDNGEALSTALRALSSEGGMVLWLHGPQVTAAGSGDMVRQALERAGSRVQLVEIAVVSGRNDLVEALDGRPEVRRVVGVSAASLSREMARASGAPWSQVIRALRPATDGETHAPLEPTRHLTRLWAANEVVRLAASGPARQAEAVALAVKHQLVTSVSGAVVLETKAQYDAHGLQPVDPATVPTVPEKASLLVLAIACLALVAAAQVLRQRRGLSLG